MTYALNPYTTKEVLLNHGFRAGSWRHGDSTDEWYSRWWPLYEDVELSVHINMTTTKWDEFEDTDVIDDDFGQPYSPFYDCVYDGAERFDFVNHVIEAYYVRMDALVESGILVKV